MRHQSEEWGGEGLVKFKYSEHIVSLLQVIQFHYYVLLEAISVVVVEFYIRRSSLVRARNDMI